MILYLAGVESKKAGGVDNILKTTEGLHVLGSFYKMKGERYEEYIQGRHNFLLDSGAFTFMGGAREPDWDDYVNRYIDFIKTYKIDLYFELDIDVIVGLDKVEYYRSLIEDSTGVPAIPVWHSYRGIDYWYKMVEEYDYISLGASGKHDSKWVRRNTHVLHALVSYARSKGVKVHGLGFTDTRFLTTIPFTSVDSTSWMSGGMYGQIYVFTGTTMVYKKPGNGNRMTATYKEADTHNFKEWIKYQKYLLEW